MFLTGDQYKCLTVWYKDAYILGIPESEGQTYRKCKFLCNGSAPTASTRGDPGGCCAVKSCPP